MNDLMIIEENGVAVIDSREVAEYVEKNHNDLMRDLRTYEEYLTGANLRSLDFFIPSIYVDAKGEERPNYLVTRKGCEMIANKLTGQKGVIFTAKYIERFHEYEQQLSRPMTPTDLLELQVRALRSIEQKQTEQAAAIAATNARLDTIKDTIQLNPASWREDSRRIIVQIAQKLGGNEHIRVVTSEMYEMVDARAGVSLAKRLTNKRQRMALEGVCKSKRDRLTRMDIIAEDKKLIEISTAIIKEMAIKYLDGDAA